MARPFADRRAGPQVVPKAFFTTMTFDEWGVVATAILSDRKVASAVFDAR
ncbi:hypothetical protein EMIT0158MI4_20108 [Burkholderia ambifaria]